MNLPPSYVKVGLKSSIDDNVRLGVVSPGLKGNRKLMIGSNAIIRSGTVIYGKTLIGKNFETGHNVVIRERNKIGDNFCIWNHSTVDYGCTIGNNVKIHCQCYVAQYTILEDNVFMAPGVIIANDLYPGLEVSAKAMRGPHLEKGVQVGINVTILPYVRIGTGSMIGAGSVVTRDIPPRSLVYGNPAHVHGKVSPRHWARKINFKIQ